ncbi:MAG: hypothetical protein ACM31L_20280 [Actinomycetota bacterium]
MPGHERRDIDIRLTAWSVAGLLATVAVVAGLMALLLWGLGGGGRPLPAAVPHAEGVQDVDEPARLAAEKEPLLGQWGWADAAHRLARIPVDEAARMVVRRGWR